MKDEKTSFWNRFLHMLGIHMIGDGQDLRTDDEFEMNGVWYRVLAPGKGLIEIQEETI